MVEHTTHNRCVAGSIPAIATGIFPITSSLALTGLRSAKVKDAAKVVAPSGVADLLNSNL